MNIAQLSHFIAVADAGSVTCAVEAVNLTQPALSRSISTLEQEMGLRLIDRSGKRCSVSPAAETVMVRARYIVLWPTTCMRSAPNSKAEESIETDTLFVGIAAAIRKPLSRAAIACLSIWPAMAKIARFGVVTLAR